MLLISIFFENIKRTGDPFTGFFSCLAGLPSISISFSIEERCFKMNAHNLAA
ncbi:DUF3953 domain-containing protein [Gorillibacterium timonense]|uniref:DUF3953 domain-containing protein n=1 Tax=Gorillibacterium timonense TaxID=1689269 RepID=UPI001CA3233B